MAEMTSTSQEQSPVDEIRPFALRSLRESVPSMYFSGACEIMKLPTLSVAFMAAYARFMNIYSAAQEVTLAMRENPHAYYYGYGQGQAAQIFRPLHQRGRTDVVDAGCVHLTDTQANSVIADVQALSAEINAPIQRDTLTQGVATLPKLLNSLLQRNVRNPLHLYFIQQATDHIKAEARNHVPQTLLEKIDNAILNRWVTVLMQANASESAYPPLSCAQLQNLV